MTKLLVCILVCGLSEQVLRVPGQLLLSLHFLEGCRLFISDLFLCNSVLLKCVSSLLVDSLEIDLHLRGTVSKPTSKALLLGYISGRVRTSLVFEERVFRSRLCPETGSRNQLYITLEDKYTYFDRLLARKFFSLS